ncbi:hypothetical protein D9M70_560070 [compost metagenome]
MPAGAWTPGWFSAVGSAAGNSADLREPSCVACRSAGRLRRGATAKSDTVVCPLAMGCDPLFTRQECFDVAHQAHDFRPGLFHRVREIEHLQRAVSVRMCMPMPSWR